MARKRRQTKPEKKEKPVQQDFISYFDVVKDTSERLGPIRFVIEDDYGTSIRVCIEEGKASIGGREATDEQVRTLIAAARGDFERLFLEAAKKYDKNKHVIPAISLAKMTDISGKAKKPVLMDIFDGEKNNELKIERVGQHGLYHLNGKRIDRRHAEKFVLMNYNAFLLGMKQAVKEATSFRQQMIYDTDFTGKRPKHEMTIKDGKIEVDIRKYLAKRHDSPKKAISAAKQKEMMAVRGSILQNGRKKGYVEA